MTRVKRSVHARKKRRATLQLAKGYRGEAQLKPGATVGLLEQEPQLDESKDVRGNVEDGVRDLRDLVDRYNEVAANDYGYLDVAQRLRGLS